jgi:hypothetical protein
VQASELRDSLSEMLAAMRYERAAGALREQRRLRDAYYMVEDGPVVLLHTKVPQELSEPGVRIAIGAYRPRSVATRWENGDHEVPL